MGKPACTFHWSFWEAAHNAVQDAQSSSTPNCVVRLEILLSGSEPGHVACNRCRSASETKSTKASSWWATKRHIFWPPHCTFWPEGGCGAPVRGELVVRWNEGSIGVTQAQDGWQRAEQFGRWSSQSRGGSDHHQQSQLRCWVWGRLFKMSQNSNTLWTF